MSFPQSSLVFSKFCQLSQGLPRVDDVVDLQNHLDNLSGQFEDGFCDQSWLNDILPEHVLANASFLGIETSVLFALLVFGSELSHDLDWIEA